MDRPSYQRAVTPTHTIDTNANSNLGNAFVRGKLLSYQTSQLRRGGGINRHGGGDSQSGARAQAAKQQNGYGLTNNPGQVSGINGMNMEQRTVASAPFGDMNVQGRSTAGRNNNNNNSSNSGNGSNNSQYPSVKFGKDNMSDGQYQDHSSTRSDLIPLSDEIPPDGIVFARIRNDPNSLVVFRTPEERLRNPERLNLDRRQLDVCPILDQELRLRLLNFQNNNIRYIRNLENLPNLIFLDLYNNKLVSLDGPVSSVKGLRVLMAGKNRIQAITNLANLRKLDVLDLHSNDIRVIEGLDGLSDLRVLNLAGNKITMAENLKSLHSLTELNLRRNSITKVVELDALPALQRVFLSHNSIAAFDDMECIFNVKFLIELSLDGNPVSTPDVASYRQRLIGDIPGLRHLDLKRITDEEKTSAFAIKAAANKDKEDTDNDILNNEHGTMKDGAYESKHGNKENHSKESVPDTTIIDVDHVGAPIAGQGIASLARTGRISAHHSFFDLELITQNEKALVAVGESWEWVQAKRLLVNVIEASLYHMSKGTIISKFSANLAWLPSLTCLRLVNNELTSLRDVDAILDSLGVNSNIKSLTIRDSPICASQTLLRAYIVVQMPNLQAFNDIEISSIEREDSARTLKPALAIHHLAVGSNANPYMLYDKNKTNSNISLKGGRMSTAAIRNNRNQKGLSITSSDEQTIMDMCANLTGTALHSTKSLQSFEEELKKEIKNIFIDVCYAVRGDH